jgi:hypothetical protein
LDQYTASPISFLNGKLLGPSETFFIWLRDNQGHTDFRPYPLYKALGRTQFKEITEKSGNKYISLDIHVDGASIGAVVLEVTSL